MVELGEGPVAGGCFLGLLEALFEQNSDGSAYADLSPVSHFSEYLVEIENMIERDSESISDLSVIVLQSKADFEDVLRGDKFGSGFLAIVSMKLEDEGFVGEGKLHHVRAGAFLSFSEGWLGFGVETANSCAENFIDSVAAFGPGFWDMDFVGRNSREGRKEGGLRFRGRYQVRRLVRVFLVASFGTVGITVLTVVGPGSGFTHLVAAGRYLGRSWVPLQTLDAFGVGIAKFMVAA